ncbi:MAG: WYL domain-containing protein [Bacteroidetes bacterium]|nr:WYL domain-containing protein [Bacteroidota bacterium]
MPINKLALIRYKTIDNCLQNRFRKWTLEDLMEAVSDALYEYEGMTKGISKRTIQLDLQNMRSEKLGYNAPIIVTDKKYYSYDESNYSITNTPLSKQDLGTLNEVLDVLKQFKGFGYFQELTGMVTKLEDKIYKQKHKGRSYIDFEKNELLKGLEFIDPLHKAIISKTALQLSYQSFKAEKPNDMIFFPYLLKEYRNRWFVLGANKKSRGIINLALDRIVELKELRSEKYHENKLIDIATYYNDTIGVTKAIGQKPQTIVIRIDKANAPYVKTKPLHTSQTILKEDSEGMIFSITVVWNFELERELLGFGEQIEVLAPKRLVGTIQSRLKNSLKKYHNPND